MENERKFHTVNARHVASPDGIHVEFINAHEVAYYTNERSLILSAERFIAEDGAPDGRIVSIGSNNYWNDGKNLTPSEQNMIISDLHAAALPLKSRFRFSE